MSKTAAGIILEANVAYLSLLRGEGEQMTEFIAAGYTAHLTDRTMTGGHELVRSVAAKFKQAFTELSVEVQILVEGTDRVAWQRIIRGTQTGAFYGFPASGREVVWREMITTRIEDGRIAEEWVISDLAERLLLSRKRAG